MHGGLVGYLGYDIIREIERLPNAPDDQLGLADSELSIIGQIAAFDHWRQRVVLIENVVVDPSMTEHELDVLYDGALARLDEFADDGASALDEPLLEPPSRDDVLPATSTTMPSGGYRRAVEASKELIRAGDVFQVVLAQRFDFELDADPFDVYRVLRQINPSPYMYFVRTADVSLVGASPEPLVKIEDGRVISRPIAGTRRRGKTEIEDRALGAELAEDPKERAEHVMLVDLARNDVGRVCDYGTVELDEVMQASDRSLAFEVRKPLLDRAQQMLSEDARMLPIYYNVIPELVSDRVENYRGSGTNFGSFWNLWAWRLTR